MAGENTQPEENGAAGEQVDLNPSDDAFIIANEIGRLALGIFDLAAAVREHTAVTRKMLEPEDVEEPAAPTGGIDGPGSL